MSGHLQIPSISSQYSRVLTRQTKSVRQNRASKLRASNYDGSETEWESALTKTLLGKADEDSHMDALTGLECVADISPSGDELEIIWRRNVSGITVRASHSIYLNHSLSHATLTNQS